MTRVFISSPYSHPDTATREDRVRIAGDACAWLYSEGFLPVSPIVHWHQTVVRNGLPDNALAWTEWNRRWLEASDAVGFLHIDGWQDSTGMAMERAWAADKPQATLEQHNGSFRWVGHGVQERLLSGRIWSDMTRPGDVIHD